MVPNPQSVVPKSAKTTPPDSPMTDPAPQVEAAAAYETVMVPALFQGWTERVLDAAGVTSGQTVLDVACGTGVLARAASRRSALTVGIDPNPGMLAVAQEIDSTVRWKEGVAESLPFPDGSFDAVVSQFGLMFFADRAAAIREMFRVLKPGGALAVAVWDTLDSSPAYAAEVEVIQRIAGRHAADALRAPFVLGNRDELVSLFQHSGIASLQVSSSSIPARFPSVWVMVEADLRGWLPVMGVNLPEEQIAQILEETVTALASFIQANNEIVFESSAHIATAKKP